MPRNVEIKARLSDPETVRERVRTHADGPLRTMHQRDTFFRAPRGRLKLREIVWVDASPAGEPGTRAELIFYERLDAPGPTLSTYRRAPCPDPEATRALLSAALGTAGEVRKRRTVAHVGPTRIHLDAVDGLGDFLELEVVLRDGQAPAEGERLARHLLADLGVPPEARVSVAYADLLMHGA
jgi:adenylate cyclase class IV